MIQTTVGINTWVAHRDHRVFGDDAKTFNPDRWLVDDAARLSMMNRYYMPVRAPTTPINYPADNSHSSDWAPELALDDMFRCLKCPSSSPELFETLTLGLIHHYSERSGTRKTTGS